MAVTVEDSGPITEQGSGIRGRGPGKSFGLKSIDN